MRGLAGLSAARLRDHPARRAPARRGLRWLPDGGALPPNVPDVMRVPELKQVAMADDVVRPRLGRGLAALIGDFGDDNAEAAKSQAQRKVAVEFLRPNPRNPRRRFNE